LEEEYIVVYCTVPNVDVAHAVSDHLVFNGLAACVNIIPGLTSIYRWKGEICRDTELLLIIKTRKSQFDPLKNAIIQKHPYQVPEIISLTIADGHQPYLSWIKDSTSIINK